MASRAWQRPSAWIEARFAATSCWRLQHINKLWGEQVTQNRGTEGTVCELVHLPPIITDIRRLYLLSTQKTFASRLPLALAAAAPAFAIPVTTHSVRRSVKHRVETRLLLTSLQA